MARTSQYQNCRQSDQTILNDPQMAFPCEEQFSLPTSRIRIHEQRHEGAHGKDIEKQPIKPVPVPQGALKKIRDRDGYEGAMDDAVANP
jgi:hypothetical protein